MSKVTKSLITPNWQNSVLKNLTKTPKNMFLNLPQGLLKGSHLETDLIKLKISVTTLPIRRLMKLKLSFIN